MKRNLRLTYALAASMLLGAATASAQSTRRAELEVPFAFEVAGQTMPAGAYSLQSGDYMKLQNVNTWKTVATVWLQSSRADDGKARLTFVKMGNRHFLRSAEFPGRIGRWKITEPGIAMQASAAGDDKKAVEIVTLLARR